MVMPDTKSRQAIATTSQENKELIQVTVHPQTPDWNIFLALTIGYLCENWPSVLQGETTKETFSQAYEQQLLHRIQEGGRILLLWKVADDPVGFANAWLEENTRDLENGGMITLQIAEFSILEKYRRMGWGRLCLQNLTEIAKSNKAGRIIAEVDRGIAANKFWTRVMTHITKDEKERNLYWRYC